MDNVRKNLAGSIAVALSLAAASPAMAQSARWQGLYLGINAGAAWSESTVSNQVCDSGTNCYFSAFGGFPEYGHNFNAAGSGKIERTMFSGGAQAGYNLQMGNVVLGIETDLNAMKLRGSRVATAAGGAVLPPGIVYIEDQVSANYLGTLRGRIGYSAGSMMVYFTGGLAYSNIKHSFSVTETGVGIGCSDSTNYCDIPGSNNLKTGYTVGGGAEWAIDRNWSIKAEYLYVDFGSVKGQSDMNRFSIPNGQGLSVIQHSADLSLHTARVGLNYKF